MRVFATCVLAMLAAGCEKSGPKPSDADIAAYLAQSQPAYVHVGQVGVTSMRPAEGGHPGAWRIDVHYTLHAGEDLYAPTPAARAQRIAFDRAVAAVEDYRLPRIADVERLARQVGLMPDGARAPEPAMEVALVTRKDDEKPDSVTLLAQPEGHAWQFFQLTAQSLADDQVGAPLDELKRASPATQFVTAGTEEARTQAAKAARFLDVLSRAPKP